MKPGLLEGRHYAGIGLVVGAFGRKTHGSHQQYGQQHHVKAAINKLAAVPDATAADEQHRQQHENYHFHDAAPPDRDRQAPNSSITKMSSVRLMAHVRTPHPLY